MIQHLLSTIISTPSLMGCGAFCYNKKDDWPEKRVFPERFHRNNVLPLHDKTDKSGFMEEHNILCIANRSEFRAWLEAHHASERECWVDVKRGRPVDDKHFWYLDAVEEALCFGWIDSRHKLIDGKRMQCFTPRKRNSPWTELNKERVRRLDRLGLMTDAGRKVLPPMGVRSFKIDKDVEAALKSARAWTKYKSFSSPFHLSTNVFVPTMWHSIRPETRACMNRPCLTLSQRPKPDACLANGTTTADCWTTKFQFI